MPGINNITSTASPTPALPASGMEDSRKTGMMSSFEDWMKVWVATISHQDPLDPMDAGEMATQFATFGQAIGLIDVKDELKKANAMQANGQLLDAASQIDRVMEFKGRKFYFGPEDASEVRFTPPANAKRCSVLIMDQRSRIVDVKTLETNPDSPTIFKWDGKLRDGTIAPRGEYQIKVQPIDDDKKVMIDPKTKKEYEVETIVKGRVSGGSRLNGTPMIMMGGDGGASYPLEAMLAIQSTRPQHTQKLEEFKILEEKLKQTVDGEIGMASQLTSSPSSETSSTLQNKEI